MGKSRLTLELTRSQRLDGWLVLQAGAQSYGKNTSYLPVNDLLKRYFKIEDQDVSETTRAKVVETILTLDHALNGVVPGLLALLDAHGDDSEWKQLDPAQRRQRMLDAVKRLLLREAQNQPLLVILEDLHWIDSETQALLESLVESLPAARMLLLVNYRPEYQHAWGSKTYYTQLRLDALPLQSANELLRVLLGADASVEPIKPVLIARTGGNPLFLEESVRTLVETRALVGERGDYRLTVALADVQVPPSVQSILAARIDRLAPEAKRLLQSAAVIGMDVPFKLLLAIADVPEAMLHAHLAHLQAAEFLYEAALFPDLEYTFKHALTHEVATAVSLRSAGALSMRRSSTRWKCRFATTVWRSRWTALPTTHCGENCGKRLSAISVKPATGPLPTRPIARRPPPSIRPSSRCRISRRLRA